MPKLEAKDSSEKLQITVLTLAMTGGGFALLTLVFVFFLNPGAANEADRLQKRSDNRRALLSCRDRGKCEDHLKQQSQEIRFGLLTVV